MSLESKIEQLTQAVIQLTAAMQQGGNGNTASRPVEAPVQAAPAPVVTVAPVQQATAMPAPPAFNAPAAAVAPAVSGAPFSDVQGMIQYVMSAYQSMGPEKGAKIQGILQSMGYSNINDVKPEHFGQLFQGVEALKAA